MEKLAVLKQYFGHSAFRPGQEALIDALLSGGDVLGVMPTGAGKSLCYQIPALLLPGITLVVSPLISLMQDQVAALVAAGVPVAFINSSLTPSQYRQVFARAEAARYQIIYVAPERLATADFLRLADNCRISLVAVDEAHCVSQWGQDFRPSYLKIVEFIDKLPYRPAVGAFTATATGEVRQDIVRILRLRQPLLLTTGFDRQNLCFQVETPQHKLEYLRLLLEQRSGKSGIIYCATRKGTEAVCDALGQWGIGAACYHAGLSEQQRRQNQEDFVYDRVQVMVATNAFGMGIDKSNVSFVIHYNMPKNLESYYQEAGRAGRDGEPADCILLFSAGDVQTAKYLICNASENTVLSEQERQEVQNRELQRLAAMTAYCKTGDCLRATILRYFGETHEGDCGNCGNCNTPVTNRDITIEAQKILSCVVRCEHKFGFGLGITLYVRALRGSREKRVLQLGLDQLPTYGLLRQNTVTQIRQYIDCLIDKGYLQLEDGQFPVLHLTERAGEVLFRGERVTMPVKLQTLPQTSASHTSSTVAEIAADEGLLTALKALRTRLATAAGVPAYVIFSNATLTDMAAKAPRDLAGFLQVSGVGQVKAQRYAEDFLQVIAGYAGE